MQSLRWLRQLGKRSMPSRSLLGLLLLLVASYVGNLTRWTLFFDIDFIFGSIAVWLVVCFYGIRWGTLAGFVSGLCTYVLWHHPYTVITFTCETLFVSWLFQRYRQNLVLLDGLFWLLLGMPMVWLFYAILLQVDPVQAQIILLKQPINGLFNALMASLLVTYLPIHQWLQRPQAVNTRSFQQTLLNLLVAFVFLPTLLLIVLGSRDVVGNIQMTAQAELSRVSGHTATELRAWYQEHRRSLDRLARQMADPALATLQQGQQQVEATQQLLPDFARIMLVSADATTVLASTSASPEGVITTADQVALQRAQKLRQPFISNVLPGSTPASIVWSVPVLRGHELRGLILAELTLKTLATLLEQNDTEATVAMTLVGRQQVVIASTNGDHTPGQFFDHGQAGEMHWLAPQTYQWFPTQGSQLIMVRWMRSFFVQAVPLGSGLPWTLVAEVSATPSVRDIQKLYTRNLALILAIAVLALLFSALLSRQLVRPLAQLAAVTTNLPDKLLNRQAITWTDSQITEIAFLVQNFRTMGVTLTQQFQELQQGLDYEALLKQITDKVRDSLDEDQILQTAVQALGQGLSVLCCDAALYNADQTTATISYEYTTAMPPAQGTTFPLSNELADVHSRLLQGQHCQFCFRFPYLFRPLAQGTTILACPIVDDQEVLGDLWLFKPQATIFSRAEVRLVQQVANQCAIALRQSRLFQAAQIQVKALEELNMLKDDFLSTVSHELRTPLTNIKMAIKMLQLAEREDQRQRYVKILQQECERETGLINDLLDLQRLASGTQLLNLEPIAVKDWVAQIVASFQERTRQRQQTLQIELPPELPIITSDAACLERILAELLHNACKYTPPGEQIRVSAKTINPANGATDVAANSAYSPLPNMALLALSVCNSGVEIPPEALEHLFDKFYRVPGGDRWKQGGTGLGLALVQKMAVHLGGNIHVTSAAQNTCFTVELPVKPESH